MHRVPVMGKALPFTVSHTYSLNSIGLPMIKKKFTFFLIKSTLLLGCLKRIVLRKAVNFMSFITPWFNSNNMGSYFVITGLSDNGNPERLKNVQYFQRDIKVHCRYKYSSALQHQV